MYVIASRFPDGLVFQEGGPFVSLYQPTHRHFPENKRDPIVFKNLLRQIEIALRQQTDREFTNLILKPFYQLEEDFCFWNASSDGIAVLATKNRCVVYRLHGPVAEMAAVANHFHLRPLLQAFQSVESYQLLGLSRNSCKLYQGNRYGFSQIATEPDFPGTMDGVVGERHGEPYCAQRSFGGTGEPGVHHGQGDKKERDDKETEKYFRFVDRFVFEHYSKPSKLPLILVALKEYHSLFEGISHNPYLLKEGINISYDSQEMEQVTNKALEMIKPISELRLLNLAESYQSAESESLGSSDLAQVIMAAYESRIETVLMEEKKIALGKIDYATGKIIRSDSGDDLLDDLAELVLKNGGAVWVLPKDNMPGDSGIAAIYRYQ